MNPHIFWKWELRRKSRLLVFDTIQSKQWKCIHWLQTKPPPHFWLRIPGLANLEIEILRYLGNSCRTHHNRPISQSLFFLQTHDWWLRTHCASLNFGSLVKTSRSPHLALRKQTFDINEEPNCETSSSIFATNLFKSALLDLCCSHWAAARETLWQNNYLKK